MEELSDESAPWVHLPLDALAVIINSSGLRPRDIANMRGTCSLWRSTVNQVLERLSPAPHCTMEQFKTIPQAFPLLQQLDMRGFDYRLFNHQLLLSGSEAILSSFLASLARMPSLNQLLISTAFATEMGRKAWAAHLCKAAFAPAARPPGPPLPLPSNCTCCPPIGSGAAAASGAGGGPSRCANVGPGPGGMGVSGSTGSGAPELVRIDSSGVRDTVSAEFATALRLHASEGASTGGAGSSSGAGLQGGRGRPLTACLAPASAAAGGGQAEETQASVPAPAVTGAQPAQQAGCSAGAAADRQQAQGGPGQREEQTPHQAQGEGGHEPAQDEDEELMAVKLLAAHPNATFQYQLWLPDWGKHLPGLRTLVVAPASTRGSDAPPPPPPPAAHGAPPTLLWLRPSALRSLTSLSLAGSMLGALGPELLALTRLARLDLRACGIGSLPDGLPALRSLTHLDLGDNALRALPEQVGGLTCLQHLDLSHNLLSDIPPAALSGCTALRTLLLNNNQLTSAPEGLWQMPWPSSGPSAAWLGALHASHQGTPTRQTGTATGGRSSPGQGYDSGVTSRTPSISVAAGHGSSSPGLGSSSAGGAGGLAARPGAQQQQQPQHHQQHLAGPLPHLQHLSLSHNWLHGLPAFPQLCDLTSLTRLEVANVSDIHSALNVPPEIMRLRGLRALVLSFNTGLALCEQLGELVQLTSLEARDARLRSLPASLSKLTGLRHLDMGRNDLGADDKGCLPQGPWSSLQHLTTLLMDHNPLLAELPEQVTQLSSLKLLDVSCCALAAVPGSLARLGRLEQLVLAGNEIKFVPPGLAMCPRLVMLDLSCNPLDEKAQKHAVNVFSRSEGSPVELRL